MERLPQRAKGQLNVELSRHGSITIEQYHHIMDFLKETDTTRVTSNLNAYHNIVGSVAFFKIESALVNIFKAFKEDYWNAKQ